MQSPTWDIHILRVGRDVEVSQDALYSAKVGGVDAASIAVLIETLQSPGPKIPYHGSIVKSCLSLCQASLGTASRRFEMSWVAKAGVGVDRDILRHWQKYLAPGYAWAPKQHPNPRNDTQSGYGPLRRSPA